MIKYNVLKNASSQCNINLDYVTKQFKSIRQLKNCVIVCDTRLDGGEKGLILLHLNPGYWFKLPI